MWYTVLVFFSAGIVIWAVLMALFVGAIKFSERTGKKQKSKRR